MYRDEQPRITKWNFEPFTPPRDGDEGEVVFTKKWQKLMGGTQVEHDTWFVENEQDLYPIRDVFNLAAIPSERDTRVASSMIPWLGTNDGRHFIDKARELGETMKSVRWSRYDLSDAFVALWAIECKRSPSGNYGRVRRDTMIVPERPTIRDYEVMEITCRWLGTEMGQDFIDKARANLAHKAAMRARFPSFFKRGPFFGA